MRRSFFEESAKIVGLIKGKNLLFASHIKRGKGKANRRLFLLTCVAQKRLCSFGIACLAMFCEHDGAQCSIAFLPSILIFLSNKNSSLIYSVIICEQKNKGQCTVRVFRLINSQLHCCFYQL